MANLFVLKTSEIPRGEAKINKDGVVPYKTLTMEHLTNFKVMHLRNLYRNWKSISEKPF